MTRSGRLRRFRLGPLGPLPASRGECSARGRSRGVAGWDARGFSSHSVTDKIDLEKKRAEILSYMFAVSPPPRRGIIGRLLSPWLHLETNIWTTLSFLYWHKLNEPQKLRSRWMMFWQLFVEFDRELWSERASGWFAASCVHPRSPEHHKLRPSLFYYQRNSIKPLTSRNIIHLPSELWPLNPMSLTLM